jgi:hypothetical protein
MVRVGIRGIGRDFEGHRLCIFMSPTATEEQFQAVIERLSDDPGIARVERVRGVDRPVECGGVVVSE